MSCSGSNLVTCYILFFFCRVQQEEEKDEAEDIYGGTTDDEKEETTNKDISPQEMQGQERYISYFINSSELKNVSMRSLRTN